MIAEALTNAAKHAKATQATVRVTHDERRVVIEIEDDGVGGANPEGHGLRGLADRVEAVGGALRLESPPGRGTRLRATLAISEHG